MTVHCAYLSESAHACRRLVLTSVALVAAAITASSAVRAEPFETVGQHFELRASDLPAPYSAAPPHIAAENVVRPDGTMPKVPPGFHVGIFASGLSRPREIAVAPNGDVFVSQTLEGDVLMLRDTDGDGIADAQTVFADGFREPSGLAISGDALYVADRRAVWRLPFVGAASALTAGPREMVTRPGALGEGGGHITREIVFAPDGEHFYVSIGSLNNIGEEAPPRATIQRFRADGYLQSTFASGLRNPVGLAFYPGTDDLYAVVNEREGLGDGLVPDYLTRVVKGGFYGFPYAYLGPHPDPQFGDLRPDLVQATLTPDLLFAPQSGPLGLLFYEGAGFPAGYRGDALVALHGAWTGGRAAGFEVARIHFRDGRPEGGYETFMAGFGQVSGPGDKRSGDQEAARVWGRPVWLAEARDGAVLVSDDAANVIWRVSWAGPAEARTTAAGPEAGLAGTPRGEWRSFPGMVEPSGIEPLTSSLRTRRSPN